MAVRLKDTIKTVSAQVVALQDTTDSLDARISSKAPISNPTFTGTVSGITKNMVGLGNVDNTSDINKPVSTATQAAINTMRDSIVNGAPLVLDTLKELADAIGNDQNYAANLLTIFEKTVSAGSTTTNIYTNDLMQIKVKGSTASPIADFSQTAINLRRPLSIYSINGGLLMEVSPVGIKPYVPVLGNNGIIYNQSEIDAMITGGNTSTTKITGQYRIDMWINQPDSSAIAYYTPARITFNAPLLVPSITTGKLSVTFLDPSGNSYNGFVVDGTTQSITVNMPITGSNGYLYNKSEIDSTVDYLIQQIVQKQDTLSAYSSITSGDEPPSSSVIKSMFVYASNPAPQFPNRIVPCIRALTLAPGSLLRLQENNVNSPWLGIDDSLIISALNNRYTKGEIDFKFRQKSDSIGFSDIPVLGSVFTMVNDGLQLLGSAIGQSTLATLDNTYSAKITLSPLNDGLGYHLVDQNSVSYPIGGSSNITVSQNPTSKQLTVDLTSSVTATNLTITNNFSVTKSDFGISSVYAVPPNYGAGGWYNLGYYRSTYNGSTDHDIMMTFCGHSYTDSANANEDSILIFRFKRNASTFGGNGQSYRLGKQLYSPETIRVVKDATDATKFTFYASYRPYARGSFVQVSCPTAFTWTGTFSTTAPTGTYIDIGGYQIYSDQSPQSIPVTHIYIYV